MNYIAIFCSAADLDEKYTHPAKEMAKLLAQHGYNLVWGGTDLGLMKVIASEMQAGGRKLIAVTVDVFQDVVRKNADEIIITKNLGERKATMLDRCDAIVVLVGGIGTLDELTEVIELRKQGKHNKPIVVLNTENFYEGLKMQLQRVNDEGFIKNNRTIDEFVSFVDQPSEVIEYLNKQV